MPPDAANNIKYKQDQDKMSELSGGTQVTNKLSQKAAGGYRST